VSADFAGENQTIQKINGVIDLVKITAEFYSAVIFKYFLSIMPFSERYS